MPISYTPPRSIESDWAAEAKSTKAQLDLVNRNIAVLEQHARANEFDSVPRIKLPPLRQLRASLEQRLRMQEGNAGNQSNGGHAALSAGNFWRRD